MLLTCVQIAYPISDDELIQKIKELRAQFQGVKGQLQEVLESLEQDRPPKGELQDLLTQMERLRGLVLRLREELEELAKLHQESKIKVTPQNAQRLFERFLRVHEQGSYERSIQGFKKIFKRFPHTPLGATSAYNVACGHALSGRKEEAIDWLKKAVRHGFSNLEHMENDPDLEGIRQLPGYIALVEEMELRELKQE